ncbi:MAG: hypothetical protein WCA91_24040 [Candidatus Acidiferrales bacterium]
MGAKALHVDGVPRDIQSVEGKLNQISGKGRVVLTASGTTEWAWESAKSGHGFLTLHLLEALRGSAEIRQGDRIGVLLLLGYVVKRVIHAAQQIRREQHPAVRGAFDGDWRARLQRLFEIAGIPYGHPHRFRDTFAVDLLLASVPIERYRFSLATNRYE